MFRRIPLKAWIGIGAGIVAIIAAVIVLVVVKKKEPEAYRTIKVHEFSGEAQVSRGEDKIIDVYNGMRLESGDHIATGEESYLQLKLDDDKYILLEPETEISIEATGSKKDSKTKIHLEKGAIVNCIEEKLSDSSEYKIETPNSTMAVRGTTFRVVIENTDEDEVYAVVSVYEGKVASKLVYPDGTTEEEEVEISSGKGVQILGTDDDTMYISVDDDVDYEELELEVLQFLKDSNDKGKELSISKEELKDLIEKLGGNVEDETEKETETESETDSETESETDSETDSDEEQTSDDTEEPTSEKVTEKPTKEPDTEKETEKPTKAPTTEKETEKPTKEPETEAPTEKPTEEPTTEKETEKPTKEPETEAPTEKPTEEPTTQRPESYVVTFKYNGQIFGTQTVKAGAKATRPTIIPATTGDWDYNFATAVNDNITIEWK